MHRRMTWWKISRALDQSPRHGELESLRDNDDRVNRMCVVDEELRSESEARMVEPPASLRARIVDAVSSDESASVDRTDVAVVGSIRGGRRPLWWVAGSAVAASLLVAAVWQFNARTSSTLSPETASGSRIDEQPSYIAPPTAEDIVNYVLDSSSMLETRIDQQWRDEFDNLIQDGANLAEFISGALPGRSQITGPSTSSAGTEEG